MALKFVPANRLALLRNGEQYFPALISELDAADREIFFETYLFADDRIGSLVAETLARAARRGVAVQVVLDGFGARNFASRFRRLFDEAGVRLLIFGPSISPFTLRRDRLRRMHRKLAVIDAKCAFVGGINVIDDFDPLAPLAPRHDYAVRIEGPLAHAVRYEAARLWTRLAWLHSRRHWRKRYERAQATTAVGPKHAALVIRDSFRHRRDIERGYLEMIGAARREVIIAIAYFLPGRRFRRALTGAARRGVRVVLLVQGRTDHPVMQYASRALFGAFLDAGVEVYEYMRSELHAKVGVFDARVACVGSSNIDPFSLLLAQEANVFVADEAFATELRSSLLDALAGSRPVPREMWKSLPFLVRVRIWLAYGLARLLMSLSGTSRWH